MAATECIIQRTAGYTVMSNYHLRDKRLSLKAKGLLSVILSLPDDWDYTIAGLAVICDTGKDAIRAGIQELEKAGYISRKRLKGEGGQFGGNQYIIQETPVEVDAPSSGFPTMEKPTTEKPSLENPTEIITKELITDKTNPPISPEADEQPKTRKSGKSRRSQKAGYELEDDKLEELIRQNVGTLGEANGWNRDEKNRVYKLVMEFYKPRAVNGSPPTHTARGVNGLFRKLPSQACEAAAMLDEAIERGWTSVYPLKGPATTPPAALDDGGGVYRCL